MRGMLFKILNMSPPKPDTTKRQQKYYGFKLSYKIAMLFETEVPDIVCRFNNERSKPPAFAEKSKYLTINKHGNIQLHYSRYFPSKLKNMHSGNNLASLHNNTFKALGVLGHLCK